MQRIRVRLLGLAVALAVAIGLVPVLAGTSAAITPPPAFGAQFHGMWSSYDDAQRVRYLDQLAASGATWVRLDVSWAMLQPTSRDSYDLRWGVPFIDRVLGLITDRGLKPLVTLWMTPGWANGGAGDKVLPTDPQDYARAAQWAAQRWSGVVPAWEIWNEPNHPSYMTGADPVAYTQLLRAAYPAIKAGSPDAKVVFGGPDSNDSAWIARAYEAGAKGYFDVMATHPYMAIANLPPETPDDGTKYNFTHLAGVHALMVRYGDGDKPIWATEFGWSSHPNVGGEANWQLGVTEAQQADYLVRALELVQATMPYVTQLFWYTDRDRAGDNPQISNYGLFYNDLTPKPVYYALKDYLTKVAAPAEPPPPAALADLSVALSGPVSAAAGSTSRYTVRVANRGSADADGFTVTGTTDAGQRLRAVSTGPEQPWTCVMTTRTWSCSWKGPVAGDGAPYEVTLDVLQPGTSATALLTATVSSRTADAALGDNDALTRTVV